MYSPHPRGRIWAIYKERHIIIYVFKIYVFMSLNITKCDYFDSNIMQYLKFVFVVSLFDS